MNLRLAVLAALLSLAVGCDCGKGKTDGGNGGGSGGGVTGGGGGTGGGTTGGGSGGGGATGGGSGGGGGATGGGSGGGGGSDGGCGLVTCASANANCGPLGDGCGGTLDCGSCNAPQTCGGGGVPSQCGGNNGCTARTCASIGANCGPEGDGCGGLLNCGVCPSGQTCGGGGINGRCGVAGNLSDAGTCIPRDCAAAGANCGPIGDGCGGLITTCGTCMGLDICGGGGLPSQCGHTVTCVAQNCTQLNANCGVLGDGCGGTVNCGTCSGTDSCGGGGTPNRCGSPACTPLTCPQLSANCGQQGDGCGGVLNCGTCSGTDICGGGGFPNVCGGNVPDGGLCTNLCQQQVACDSGSTTISGNVVAPTNPANGYGQPDPINGALVYVPNAPVAGFDAGVSCDQCGAQASGKPLVTAYSALDGGFTLANAPCGTNIPLVIQLGRWRREVTIPNVQCCVDNPLSTDLTHLPRNKSEGNIPAIAVVTGNADPIECVLPKIGIDTAEFTNPGGGGRVNFYRDNGARISTQTPAATTLYNDAGVMAQYDMLILDCVGSQVAKNSAQLQNLGDYAGKGGRIFASHYAYVWMSDQLGSPGNYVGQTSPFPGVANWAPQNNNPTPQTGLSASIDTSFSKGMTFAQWLLLVGGSSSLGSILIDQTRYDFTSVINPPSQQWVYRSGNIPVEFTFNCPVGAPANQQCGRVLFSDFHVNTGGSASGNFPGECNAASPLTPQEKVLEYLLFDLSSCIVPDNPPPPSCTPMSCGAQGFMCGQQGDGCGNLQSCGNCPTGQACINGVCTVRCTPTTCGALGYNCGVTGDGCGGTLNCGTCMAPQSCGGGGTPGVCGGGACLPLSCASQGFNCGQQGNGCGGMQDCGMCPMGQICGAGGPGVCGSPGCTPVDCASQGLDCGPAGDGCGNLIQCGTCALPDTCGGGGTPGQCGHPNCTPTTCAAVGANCGTIADGCGGSLSCGFCTAPQTCGGGGVANVCGSIG